MRRRRMLRPALACCLLVTAALPAAGCSPGKERTVVVLGPWTGGEERPFVETLKKIGERTGHTYVYQGTRSLRETLATQLRTESPPDVAILNGLGELSEYARQGAAEPLREDVAASALGPWAQRITLENQKGEARQSSYGVPVRVDLKSIVWSRPGDRRAAGKPRWCLGMASGATSGWPGTDWIEDLLLQKEGPDVYGHWALGELSWTSPEVKRAWQTWRDLLAKEGPKAAETAISTEFENLGGGRYGLLNTGRCTREHQGSFIRRHYADDVLPAPTHQFVPGLPADRRAFEVSGDMAAVFRPGDAAWELLTELTSRQARAEWASLALPEERPFFSDGSTGDGPLSASTAAVQRLFRAADKVCFDASDAMPSTLRNAFQRAVLEFLQDPQDPGLLDRLLKQLEAERKTQEGAGAFVLDHLCGRLGN
ncbi:ABC transporter substrate-binding protein [Streptomyces sp. NPDC018019]|uniref:ABC transporter substrate-binding protein n=1 Tax=Streptomyces sp. NPDC018019 TaxID=3365030 RepID=UPI00378DF8CC